MSTVDVPLTVVKRDCGKVRLDAHQVLAGWGRLGNGEVELIALLITDQYCHGLTECGGAKKKKPLPLTSRPPQSCHALFEMGPANAILNQSPSPW